MDLLNILITVSPSRATEDVERILPPATKGFKKGIDVGSYPLDEFIVLK